MDGSTEPLLFERVEGVGLLTLNRPAVLNAFDDEIRAGLLERLATIASDARVRCVMITGAGRAFSAGGDIVSMVELQMRDDHETIGRRIRSGGQVMAAIRALPKPVIAAVNGAAAGGGMNLALGCDIRLGSSKALFSQAFVKIGLVPDWGGFHSLTRIAGTAKAMEWMMTGDRIGADEAYRWGLLNHLYEAGRFRDDAMAFAARLASGPAEALAHIKTGVYLGASATPAEVVAFEERVQSELFLRPDAREGMRAFLDKRPPRFGVGDGQPGDD